jgi:hypothetical protein
MKETCKIIISIFAAILFVLLVIGLLWFVIKVTFYVSMIVLIAILSMCSYYMIPWKK